MKAYYRGGARGQEWACVEGTPEDTDSQAVETAREAYGSDWIMPVFVTSPTDWKTNPKMAADGKRMLWLLVKV